MVTDDQRDRATLAARFRWAVYALTLVVVAALSLAVANLYLTDRSRRHVERTNREATCAVVLAQVQVYEETPPQTVAGRNAAESWSELALWLGCIKEE